MVNVLGFHSSPINLTKSDLDQTVHVGSEGTRALLPLHPLVSFFFFLNLKAVSFLPLNLSNCW